MDQHDMSVGERKNLIPPQQELNCNLPNTWRVLYLLSYEN